MALGLLGLGYQNCSQEIGTFNSKPRLTNESAPFPVAITVDMIGVTTCGNDADVSNGIFNYRIKAKNPLFSGVKASNDFLDYIEERGFVGDQDKIAQVISEAVRFEQADLYMGMLSSTHPVTQEALSYELPIGKRYVQSPVTSFSSVNDFYEIAALKEGDFSSELVFTPSRRHYDLFTYEFGAKTEETLRQNVGAGQYLLSLFFTKSRNSHGPRGPMDYSGSASSTGFYGTGYKLEFADEQFDSNVGGNIVSLRIPNTRLTRVSVVDGESLDTQESWSKCTSYRILPESDKMDSRTGCQNGSWRSLSYANSATIANAIERAENNHLFDLLGDNDGWQINSHPGCRSVTHTKAAACYQNNANIIGDAATDISYNKNDWHTCNDENLTKGIYCCEAQNTSGQLVKLCPRFISVCSRY